jgi:hypothetical protein
MQTPRKVIVTLTSLFLSTCACLSQPTIPCGQPLDAALHSGALLTIDSRPAGIEIVPTDAATEKETIHVTCKPDSAEHDTDSSMRTHLQLSGTPSHTTLTITGVRLEHNGVQIRIEVPRKTNLELQMPAGQVTVEDVVGDKDIELKAGQITISSTHTWNYRKVDVSVGIGQVNAQVYGANKGGFFRDFHKQDAGGEYRLHAHVMTGQIDLLGKRTHTAADPE